MKQLILFLLLLAFKTSFAFFPPGDLLIIGKDSINIPAHPIAGLDSLTMGRLEHWQGHYAMTGGYRCIWQVIDNKVYLTGFYGSKHSAEIINESFCEQAENGKVFADWLSGTIWIPDGQFLRMDPFYNHIYEKEKMLVLVNGHVQELKSIVNYIPVPNGIQRINTNAVKDTLLKLFKQSNLKALSSCGCLPAGYEICVNEKGKIEDVSLLSFAGRTKGDTCIQVLRQKLADLQFDIIKWHGRPDCETCDLSLFYDDEKNELILL